MLGQVLDGRYRIIEALGSGGFGQTYIAEDTHIPGNPKCVVKHLKPASNDPKLLETARRLFKSEGETLAKLGRHNQQIPQILAYLEQNQEFYLVQEFIEGHPLSQELTPGKQLSEPYVVALLQDVLPVLEFIHQQNVIHRDIKPDNIIRRKQDGRLVLIDFGAVKHMQAIAATVQNPVSATVAIGTPGYMPAEQGRGQPRPNSDIYALGMIAIQALTGIYPSNLHQDSQTLEILWQNYVQVSPGLAAVLTQMVRYHFQNRYQSATEALQALQHLVNPVYQRTEHVTAPTTPMHELTLKWVEAGLVRTQIIRDRQSSKNPGTVRIGRDPQLCDIVLSEPTVSGLQAEIFFNSQQQRFYLRSLRQSNLPIVNGQPLSTGEVALSQGSSLRLGKMELSVSAIALQHYPVGYTPTEYATQQHNTPYPPVARTLQTEESHHSEVNPPPPPPPPSPRNLPLVVGLGIATVVSAMSGYAYYAFVASNPGKADSTNGCSVVVKAEENIRPEPYWIESEPEKNLLEKTSKETELIATGKKTENGRWIEVKLPSEKSAWVNKIAIKDLDAMNSCFTAQKIPIRTVSDVNPPSPQAPATPIEKPSVKRPPPEPPPVDEGKILLTKAKEKANSGNFEGAIALAKEVPSKSSVFQETQEAIARWQAQLPKPSTPSKDEGASFLAKAREKANSGNFQEAINIAQEIQKNSATYNEAQEVIAQWQEQLAKQQTIPKNTDGTGELERRIQDYERERGITDDSRKQQIRECLHGKSADANIAECDPETYKGV
ncbi:MAG TPA: FHA domain-containing serine/threonine-protein kinase [Coleofasciculaceae cyanobacterium]|jgi:serine/threonine-protein kinase